MQYKRLSLFYLNQDNIIYSRNLNEEKTIVCEVLIDFANTWKKNKEGECSNEVKSVTILEEAVKSEVT